jgi:hypothetical protein
MAGADDQDPTLDIGKDGDLQGFSRAARRRLKAVSGRYRLLPSPSGLLIWERTDGPYTPSGARAPAVALAGEITGPGSLVDVLNFIHFNQWDGGLWIASQSVRKALFFEKGQLLSAQSSLLEDRLGQMLVRLGRLTDVDLVDCAREVTPERRLGTILVERGLVTTHDLYEAVQRQSEEIFHSTLLFRSGAFYFIRSLDDALPSRLHLDTQSLLLESLRRSDEMGYFRVKLPSPEVVLGRRPVQPPTDLTGPTLAVYELVDDRRSLRELVSASRLGEFAATKAAYELLQRGLVSVRAAAAVVREAPSTLLPTASGHELIDAYSGGLRRLHELLIQRKRPTLLAEGVAAFVSGSARFASIMEGVALAPDGGLPAARLTENVRRIAPGEGIARLREALAELLLFVLFLAHDHIDPIDEQAIHEQVVRAVERL